MREYKIQVLCLHRFRRSILGNRGRFSKQIANAHRWTNAASCRVMYLDGILYFLKL